MRGVQARTRARTACLSSIATAAIAVFIMTSSADAATTADRRGTGPVVAAAGGDGIDERVNVTGRTAAARFVQPTCAKDRAATRRSIGARKRAARARFQQCQANRRAFNQIKNARFVGVRTDGVEIDAVYCANGKWQSGGRVLANLGWRVTGTRPVRGGSRFTAIVEAKVEGGRHVQAIVKGAGGWKVGYEWAGKAHAAGTVEKTNARAICARL